MTRHMSKGHGCLTGDANGEAADTVLLQTWASDGSSGFWIVEDEHSASGSSTATASSPRSSRLHWLELVERTELQRTLSQSANEVIATSGSDMALLSNWMRRTGWNDLFDGENRAFLASLTRTPCIHGVNAWISEFMAARESTARWRTR